jgi:hypothetical protein
MNDKLKGCGAGQSDGPDPEVLLPGSIANHGRVVRVGNTVRRPQRSWSRATQALLHHLETVGFTGAPRFLDVDSHGREVLSYIPGAAVVEPYPKWALTDEALVSVSELIRSYHDAASTFDPSPYSWGRSPPDGFKGQIVTHNDLKPENVVFRDGRAVGLIDFDLASPGSRAWDIACAARQWAPLRPDIYIFDSRRARKLERFRLLVDSYGMDDSDRWKVAEGVGLNYTWFYQLIQTSATSGHAPFSKLWSTKTRPRAELTRRWHAENRMNLRAALGIN